MLGLLLTLGCAPLLAARAYFLLTRLRLRLGGAAAAVRCGRCEADRDEDEVYAGKVEGCPAYDKVPLPRTGGTVHVPRDRGASGVAILVVPGKGRVFNLFPLQQLLRDQGVPVDVIGVDYCAYGAGFERNVQSRWLPRLLYEMRLGEMGGAVAEALEVTCGIYRRVLVAANSTAGASVLQLLSGGAAERLPANLQGVWVTNPAIAFKDGHFVNSIVDSPLPTFFFALLDRLVGLGPAQVMADGDKDWFYFVEGQKKFKQCFLLPGHSSAVMVGVPRYQQPLNPMRFMHAAEVVEIVRGWRRGEPRRQPGGPPVYFSLNYGQGEWHCHAAKAQQMLTAWGATEVGAIETHEEWLFETEAQWAAARAVLRDLVERVLEVKWP